jgi:tetrapyrrole methylase family protein/MazG family protein
MEKTKNETETKNAFFALYETIKRLRSPSGCHWDREQTPKTLRGNLIEEVYECIEAIDEGDKNHIKEEIGDVFLLAVMISYMHEETGDFSVADALNGINQKLIRRHPHVFGDVNVKNSDEIIKNWNKIKVEIEGRRAKDSILDEVSRGLPPMERSYKLQKKAAKIGFDWPDEKGIWSKIDEETSEVKEALTAKNGRFDKIEEELGDLLFSVINLCRFLKIDPSLALQKTNIKFEKRFRFVEKNIRKESVNADDGKYPLKELDALWEKAKKTEI